MAAIDQVAGPRVVPELQIDQNTYVQLMNREGEGLHMRKFLLRCPNEGPVPPAIVERARDCIRTLLRNNPAFCAVFSLEPEEVLSARIAAKKYLIINGDAVCLSRHSFQDPIPMCDRYFNLHFLKHPVRCPQGHLLEGKRARIWAQAKGGMCPVLPEHPIGDLDVDRDEEERLRRFKEEQRSHLEDVQLIMEQVQQTRVAIQAERAAIQREREANQQLRNEMQGVVAQQQHQGEQLRLQNERERVNGLMMVIRDHQIAVLQEHDGAMVPVVGGVAKIGVVTGLKVASLLSKTVKEALKKPMFYKIVPGVGVVYGCVAAAYRWEHGQPWRAVGEGVSAVIGCIPGGSPAKVLVDVAILGADIKEERGAGQNEVILIRDLNEAYALLGLPRDGHPTEEQVHVAFAEQLRRVAGDHLGDLGPYYQQNGDILNMAVRAARHFIYQQNNWVERQ